MSTGLIDAERSATIAAYTSSLSEEDAAKADEILAAAAPEVHAETLARRAAALEMKLDPEAARTRKEKTKRVAQRVQVQLERSGNASVAGRELDIADALASKANIHAIATRLRRAGLTGSLDHLRATVFNDLLQNRNPFDRLAPVPEAPAAHDVPDEEGRYAATTIPRPRQTAPRPMTRCHRMRRSPRARPTGGTPWTTSSRTSATMRTTTRRSASGPVQATIPTLTRTPATTTRARERQVRRSEPMRPCLRSSTSSSTRAPSSAGTPRHPKQAGGAS